MKYLIRFNESVKEEKYFLSKLVDRNGRSEYWASTTSDIKRGQDRQDVTIESDDGQTLEDFIEDAKVGDIWIRNPDTIITCIEKFTPGISSINSYNERITKIREFSQESLVYLLDIDFYLYIDSIFHQKYSPNSTDNIEYSISLKKKKHTMFNWEEIKYDFIPFIELLNIKYIITEISFNHIGNFGGKYAISVHDILNEKLTKDDISSIMIKIR
jgi:hypothetical protein